MLLKNPFPLAQVVSFFGFFFLNIAILKTVGFLSTIAKIVAPCACFHYRIVNPRLAIALVFNFQIALGFINWP
jgi:hypothetical protein